MLLLLLLATLHILWPGYTAALTENAVVCGVTTCPTSTCGAYACCSTGCDNNATGLYCCAYATEFTNIGQPNVCGPQGGSYWCDVNSTPCGSSCPQSCCYNYDTCNPTPSGMCINTEAPTTASPTVAPTASPTPFPTTAPTVAPTPFPTEAPIAGTAAPTTTLAPTVAPTASPTPFPTTAPTAAPSPFPTAAPTTSPTATPSAVPTVSPTRAPTVAPTRVPTVTPTVSPTPPGPAIGPGAIALLSTLGPLAGLLIALVVMFFLIYCSRCPVPVIIQDWRDNERRRKSRYTGT